MACASRTRISWPTPVCWWRGKNSPAPTERSSASWMARPRASRNRLSRSCHRVYSRNSRHRTKRSNHENRTQPTTEADGRRDVHFREFISPRGGGRQLSEVVGHPSRSEALDPTVTELLPNDTQPPTDTDHQVLLSLSDPNNIHGTMNEALNKYKKGLIAFCRSHVCPRLVVGKCVS